METIASRRSGSLEMNKAKELAKIAAEIDRCLLCKKWGRGKSVPGEGNPHAKVVFIGEAPGKNESETGRPFIGRSGKFLRAMIKEISLNEEDVFITSPVKYLPLRGTPSRENIAHGRIHLVKQISIIDPEIIVLLGSTACLALLDEKMQVTKTHGSMIEKDGRKYLITYHPASANRFPDARKGFLSDFTKLKKLVRKLKL